MRLVHLLDHSIPVQSGYALRTICILKEQRALGWETFHLTGPNQGPGKEREEDVGGWHFYRTPPPGGVLEGMSGLAEIEAMGEMAYRVEQVARRVRPHILHAHSPALNAIPALWVGRRLRIPVVYELRALWEDMAGKHGQTLRNGLRRRLRRALETWVLRRADAITTVCEGLRREIADRGVSPDKVTVIPHAVDTKKFSAEGAADPALRRRLGLNGALVLGFIGSFRACEGLPLLLQAMRRLLAGGEHVRALLVGDGCQDAELRRLAAALGIANEVVFAGPIPHGEVGRYCDLMDMVVYPRLAGRSTELSTPLKLLEAMAQGRLVVSSDVGGHRELIRGGETGELFKAGDPDALASTVLGLKSNRDRWPDLKAAARRFVETERSWKGSVARYEAVYKRLVDPSSRT